MLPTVLSRCQRFDFKRIPYRMVVFERMNGKTPVYRVAGSEKKALGAEKALREAFNIHGGVCFYCRKKVKPDELSIDHAEPSSIGGRPELQNLLIAHPSCNKKKGHKAIECFNPDAGREWLAALLVQVEDRLNRL
jgi:5-methylcytosine-specific restriction endonuclease McrA